MLALGPGAVDTGVLSNWPQADGLLLERRGGSVNYAFHGLALVTLAALRIEHVVSSATLVDAIQDVSGVEMPQSEINRQNNSLRGWSWIPDTFSWVEPTAWCLLALKVWRRRGASISTARVDTAERLLVDRCCADGGWNYGNSNMLGQQLKAFVPTTAIALLSLQDKPWLVEVQRSLGFLERAATAEQSGTALGLASLALKQYGRPVSRVEAALSESAPDTVYFGGQMAAAVALSGLAESTGVFDV